MINNTGTIEIEYVDYTVARNFMGAIEEWFNSLPQSNSMPIVSFLKKYAEHFPFFFKYLTAIFVGYFFYVNYERWLSPENQQFGNLFTAGVLCFATIFVASGIALKLGNIVAETIETTQPNSYLNLNRGDEIAIAKMKKSNFRNLVKVVGSFIMTIVTTLFSTWLAIYLGHK